MSDSGIGGAVKVDEKTTCVASEKQSTIARTIFFIFLFGGFKSEVQHWVANS